MTIDEIKAPFASGGDRQNISYNPTQNGVISWLAGYTYLYELKPTETPLSPYIERIKFNEIMYLMSAKMLDIESKLGTSLGDGLDTKVDKVVYANDKKFFVTTNTPQTIRGVKTFTKAPRSSATPTNNNDLVRLMDLKNSSIGTNQTWQNVTSQRQNEVTYYNTTGKPIMVCVTRVADFGIYGMKFYVNGSEVIINGGVEYSRRQVNTGLSVIVPVGASYKVEVYGGFNQSIYLWKELR